MIYNESVVYDMKINQNPNIKTAKQKRYIYSLGNIIL